MSVKHIHITTDEETFKKWSKAKGNQTWEEFFNHLVSQNLENNNQQ